MMSEFFFKTNLRKGKQKFPKTFSVVVEVFKSVLKIICILCSKEIKL